MAVEGTYEDPEEGTLIATRADVNAARRDYPTDAVPLSAHQEEDATLFHGANAHRPGTENPKLNVGVDHPDSPHARIDDVGNIQVESPVNGVPFGFVERHLHDGTTHTTTISRFKTSREFFPLGLHEEEIVYPDSATQLSQISHKIFAFFSWTSAKEGPFRPFVGVGAEAEFSSNRSIDDVQKAHGLSQWGVWLKGGTTF